MAANAWKRYDNRMALLRFTTLIASTAILACGGVTVDEDVVPTPERVFAADNAGCIELQTPSEAESFFNEAAPGDRVAVVEVFLVEECTDAGGHYLLARELSGEREYWLGGHACYFLDAADFDGAIRHGVVRVTQTAALFQLPEEVCVGFPGQAGVTTDSNVNAAALFASLEEAEQFAASLQP